MYRYGLSALGMENGWKSVLKAYQASFLPAFVVLQCSSVCRGAQGAIGSAI